MKNVVIAALAVLMPPLLAGKVLAEDSGAPALGSRLRVTTNHRLVGRLLAQDEQSLTLQIKEGKDPAVVPRAAITGVEESLRPSRKGRGFAIGAATGAVAAIVLGITTGQDCSQGAFLLCLSPATATIVGAIVFVPVGGVMGAAVAPGERWRLVSDHRVSVNVGSIRGGIGASASFRF